jgi:hypothetical protein
VERDAAQPQATGVAGLRPGTFQQSSVGSLWSASSRQPPQAHAARRTPWLRSTVFDADRTVNAFDDRAHVRAAVRCASLSRHFGLASVFAQPKSAKAARTLPRRREPIRRKPLPGANNACSAGYEPIIKPTRTLSLKNAGFTSCRKETETIAVPASSTRRDTKTRTYVVPTIAHGMSNGERQRVRVGRATDGTGRWVNTKPAALRHRPGCLDRRTVAACYLLTEERWGVVSEAELAVGFV